MRWTMRLLRKVGLVQVAMVMGLLLLVVYMLKTVVDSQELGALTPHVPLDQQQPRQVNVHPPPDLVNRRRLQPSFNSSPMNLPEDLVYFKRDIPLIWIGGVPRSGTTLMRAMVDAHPDIRCGEETRVIPRILGIHAGMTRADLEMTRLKEAKITEEVLNSALGAYILSIISKHGEPAPRLCNKDPFTLRSQQRLLQIFPNSKFILMIRDGRATVHSIISRKVSIKGFDNHSYKGALKDWNRAISTMYSECLQVGEMRCLPVYYEQLVLHPRPQMERILSFLDVPWDAVVLHHEQVIGKKGGVSLSKKELSTDQVNKPVNTEALSKWVGHIPPDVRSDMRNIAPMLETLGYDPDAYPPNYGMPDSIVHQKLPNINGNKNINQQPNDSYNKVKHKSNLYQ